jgi:phosphate transport system protein
MIEGHLARAFDGALISLHLKIVEMGGLALDQAREAMRAYENWSLEAATRVIEREHLVNNYDKEIDRDQLTLIARRQPVGSDLRVIIALSKMVGELERVGDEAKKIARVVIADQGRPAGATSRDAVHLGKLAQDLLRSALEAVDRLDFELAEKVISGDRELDEEYAAGLRRLLTRAMENPRGFEVTVQTAFVLKSLERIGDHARNLGRHVRAMRAVEDAAGSRQSPGG